MDDNQQIWQVANKLVAQIGDPAPDCASTWADERLEAGDLESRVNWMRVMVACKVLLARGMV